MLKFLVIALWAVYFFSPFDLIPDVIPGVGRLDDLLLLIGAYFWTRHMGSTSGPGGRKPGGGYGQNAGQPGARGPGQGPGYRPGYGPGFRGGAGSGQDRRSDPGSGWNPGSGSGTGYGGSGQGGGGGANSSSAGSGSASGGSGDSSQKRTDGRGASAARAEKRDPYEILGVDRTASLEDIKHAYRDKAGKYHPDKVTHLGEEFQILAKEKFQDIQWAYETIQKEKGER